MCVEKTCCRQSPEECRCCEECGHTLSFCYCGPWGLVGMSGAEWECAEREIFLKYVRDNPEVRVLLLGKSIEVLGAVRCSRHRQWYMRNGATCPACEEHEETPAPVEFIE